MSSEPAQWCSISSITRIYGSRNQGVVMGVAPYPFSPSDLPKFLRLVLPASDLIV